MDSDVTGDDAFCASGSCRTTSAENSDPNSGHEANGRDVRRVGLIKSLTSNNRFYALVEPASGICNADVVETIPHDLVLGIAYPCLEDGVNDFAVVRTAYETLDLFPDDAAMRDELREIISDARCSLIRRLMELLERLIARKATSWAPIWMSSKPQRWRLCSAVFPAIASTA
jgi:hypothetical protein